MSNYPLPKKGLPKGLPHDEVPVLLRSQLLGWTPLISKTFYNDQFVSSYNSTPTSKLFNGVLNAHPVGGDIDYLLGLNLTPFLTHNMSGPTSGPQNITPFHDKTLHLTDFFMDLPIRQLPLKDQDTITPSKFKVTLAPLLLERKFFRPSIFDLNKSALKRSITQVDTPPRQPHKLSITVKAEDEETDDETDDQDDKKYALDTPSRKVLSDITKEFNKAPGPGPASTKYETKTPVKPPPVSSPSTVLLSSAANTPKAVRETPPSPTPAKKDVPGIPAMGVFSERPKDKQKPKPKKTPKAQMQAGMNKFQIVFTDVHTLMNNKSKNKKFSHLNGSRLRRPEKDAPANTSLHTSSQEYNSTGNTSRDLSIMSAPNHSINTSASNITHPPPEGYELGGINLTPNKFFLDKMFDKASPQYYQQAQYSSMPPPRQPPVQPMQPMMTMMMMSTPQHQNIINYNNVYGSPSDHKDMFPYMYRDQGYESP